MKSTIALLAAALAFSGCRPTPEPIHSAQPPNVVIIFTDDQGYRDIGVYGARGFETPNLDRLAHEGIRFTDFYVASAVCTSSRAALLTGSYPKRLGLHEAVIFPFSTHGLNPDEVTIAELLLPLGYRTGLVGKWHLGHDDPAWMPNAQGFEYYFGVPYSNDMDSYLYRNPPFQSPPLPLFENKIQIESGPDQRYLTRRFTEAAVQFIRRHKNDPFFLYMPHIMPHVPLHPSEEFEGSSDRGVYGDVIQEIDWSVGEVMRVLEEENIADNTIILFTSDNGATEGEGIGSNAPLRGGKATTWEGGLRVPLIARWPERIPEGSVSREFATAMDILPTLAAWTGAALPANRIDGFDISELFENPASATSPRDQLLYYARNGDLEAIRQGNWKLHVGKSRGWPGDEPFPVSLYDLDVDAGESVNLADSHPDIVEQLQDELRTADAALTTGMRPPAGHD